MADADKILDGFFKNVPIRIDGSSITGGRKTSKKEFPNRDTQTIEDLGGLPRTHNLRIVIAPITTVSGGTTNVQQDYFEYRDSLLAVIEEESTGVLIHPLYGRIENVKATTFVLNEDFRQFGDQTINVVFEVDDGTGIPVRTTTALSQVANANNTSNQQVNNNIAEDFSVSTEFPDNFTDAINKVNEIIDAAVAATSFLGAATDRINEFNSFIGQLSADVNSLITKPNELADAINNLFANIDGLFGTVESTGKAFERLFDFGDNDENEIIPTTAARAERQRNRAVLNAAVNTSALSYAYTNASQTEFGNVREIEEAADILEVQYQRVITSSQTVNVGPLITSAAPTPATIGPSTEVISDITDMRVIVQQFFDEQKTTAKQIIEIETFTTTTRLLSFQYYNESESADDIISLNNISDVSFVNGTLEILTA